MAKILEKHPNRKQCRMVKGHLTLWRCVYVVGLSGSAMCRTRRGLLLPHTLSAPRWAAHWMKILGAVDSWASVKQVLALALGTGLISRALIKTGAHKGFLEQAEFFSPSQCRYCWVCCHLLTLVPRSWIFLPWRCRPYVPPKHRFTQDLHDVTSQKTIFFS
jgi:hypothetical protein